MAENRNLNIILDLKDRASKELKGFNGQLKKLKPEFKRMAVGGTVAFGAITLAVKGSLKAFQEQERAVNRLETLTRNVTGATKEQSQALVRQAQALQKLGVVGDEVAIAGQSQLATFALTTEKIAELTPALLDMIVATKGVNATQEDAISIANAVGRALEGGAGALTRYGISLTEAQKKQFDLANKMERASLLAEILEGNYGGLNASMRETSEGGAKALANSLGDMNESIGSALAPTLNNLVQTLVPVVEKISEWAEKNPDLIKGVIIATGSLAALVAVVGTLGLIIPAVVAGIGFISTGMMALSAFLLTNPLGILIVAIGIIIGKLIQFGNEVGGMKNAWHLTVLQMRISFLEFVESVITSVNKIASKIPGLKKIGADIASSVAGKLSIANIEFNSLNNEIARTHAESLIAKKGIDSFSGGLESTAVAVESVSSNTEGLSKELTNLEESYEDVSKTAGDAMFSVTQAHDKALSGFDEKIRNIQSSMSSLQKSFSQQRTGDRKTLAEEIVSAQDEASELEKKIASETSASRIAELQMELAERQRILTENTGLIESMEGDIAEVRRRAALSDLEMAVEDFRQRRSLAQQEFTEKMSNLSREMAAVRSQRAEELHLYQQKVEFISEKQKEMEELHKETTDNNLAITKEAIEKEIAMYKKLAEAINSVRGSNTVGEFNHNMGNVTSVNDAIISPNGNIISTHPDDYLIATKDPSSLSGGGGTTINISGNSFIGREDIAEKIGEDIMKSLKQNVKL
jgi:hypothetical protein